MEHSRYAILILLAFILVGCTKDAENARATNDGDFLFQQVASAKSGLNFINKLDEGLNTNILMYEYFYNGGGVAIADYNGDGMEDIYLTANMSGNKLYLNQGDLKFSDITAQSKAGGRPGPWKTGASAIDINSDGRMDIYLSYSGALPLAKRQNQLFINMGNDASGAPQFQDQAARYGLDSPAFSNQSYFLDYDRDGDLDMLLLNHNPKNLPLLSEAKTKELFKTDDQFKGLRLFLNTGNGYKDVTLEAGIQGSELSYGLSLAISDLNQDGWPDFYVSNDYNVPDYLYINKQDGTFSNELSKAMGHTSQFSMGNDVADVNGDGMMDVFTLDMLPQDNKRQKLLLAPDNYSKYDLNVRSGFYHQNMRNMLQLSNGDGTYTEVGQQAGISNTDWSWAALFADYNNDGYQDLFVTNGYNRDYTNLDFINYMEDFVEKKGRLVRENVLEIIENMPASDVENYAFQGGEGISFSDVSMDWGLDLAANSNGAAYADLDNDGDLDLVVNNINKPVTLYENTAGGNYLTMKLRGPTLNTSGIGSKVSIHMNGGVQVKEQYPGRGYLSSVSHNLHFGLGDATSVDSLVIQWPDGRQERKMQIKANQKIILDYTKSRVQTSAELGETKILSKASAPISFTHDGVSVRDFDRQALLLGELSHHGPVMETVDFNQDGREDLFANGQLYRQDAEKRFRSILELEDIQFITSCTFMDADADGDLDMYIGRGGYHDLQVADERMQDELYLNENGNAFRKLVPHTGSSPRPTTSACAFDFNEDGRKDLIIGFGFIPGRFPESYPAEVLMNNGDGTFTRSNSAIEVERISDCACTAEEVLLTSAFGPVYKVGRDMNAVALTPNGHWNTLETQDLNKDGLLDVVVGNIGTNNQLKITESSPVKVHAADYDDNGSMDPLLTYYNEGISYPLMTRDELQAQLPKFRAIYPDYQSYAKATAEDVLANLSADETNTLQIQESRSGVLMKQADGSYLWQALPAAAQYAPVYAVDIHDYDKDGNNDILLAGNNDRMKLQLGKMDANYGQLFTGDGEGGYEYMTQRNSGLSIRGDVRSLARIGHLVLVGINGKEMVAYEN